MSNTAVYWNWCPKTFHEFRSAALAGRVELVIENRHWPSLYDDVMRYSFWSVFSAKATQSYESKLLQRMIENEWTFRKVHHELGVDLGLRAGSEE